MKNVNSRFIGQGLLLVLGLVLIFGGVVTGKHGATVVGICCLGAVGSLQYLGRKKGRTGGQMGHTP